MELPTQIKSTSAPVTLVALMNAMIGGTILVLPLLFKQGGLIIAVIVTLITGLVNYYSCQICLDHLGDDPDIPQAIKRHTSKKIYPLLYEIFVAFNLLLIIMLYFDLIIIQWKSIIVTDKSIYILMANVVALFCLVFILKKYDLGVSVLGYGILSIVGYLVFLTWLFASRPSGDMTIPLFSFEFASLSDTLATAFSLQGVFVPVLRKNKNSAQMSLLLILAYVLGGLVYSYIGFAGAFGITFSYLNSNYISIIKGIMNRVPYVKDPQTVEEYFSPGEWEVRTVASIYLIHLYSVFPEYLLIAKKRFFGIFKWQHDQQKTDGREILFLIAAIILCTVVNIAGVSLNTILSLNGSLIAFFFIYLLPIGLHLKCVYFKRQSTVELSLMADRKSQMPTAKQNEDDTAVGEIQRMPNPASEEQQSKCNGSARYGPTGKLVSLVLMCLMLLFGIFMIAYTLYSLIVSLTG